LEIFSENSITYWTLRGKTGPEDLQLKFPNLEKIQGPQEPFLRPEKM
jgi:hypothetical protein